MICTTTSVNSIPDIDFGVNVLFRRVLEGAKMSDTGEINSEQNIPENSEAEASLQDEETSDATDDENSEGKKRSPSWKYYNATPIDGATFAKCKFCDV